METKIIKEMEKSVVKNFLDIVIMTKMRELGCLSGYDAIEFILKKFGFIISSGTVYALLYSLERRGFIKCESNQEKRIYALADKGKEYIDAILQAKEEVLRFMRTLFSG